MADLVSISTDLIVFGHDHRKVGMPLFDVLSDNYKAGADDSVL